MRKYTFEELSSMMKLNVSITRTWSAHNVAVNSIQIIDEPNTILTCSQDQSIRIWTNQGNELGYLDANELKGIHVLKRDIVWNFPVDMKKRRQLELERGSKVLNDLLLKHHLELTSEGLSLPPMSNSLRKLYENEEKEKRLKATTFKINDDVQDNQSVNASFIDENEENDSSQESDMESDNDESDEDCLEKIDFVRARRLTRILRQGEQFRRRSGGIRRNVQIS